MKGSPCQAPPSVRLPDALLIACKVLANAAAGVFGAGQPFVGLNCSKTQFRSSVR